jgi:hypothetical protein
MEAAAAMESRLRWSFMVATNLSKTYFISLHVYFLQCLSEKR